MNGLNKNRLALLVALIVMMLITAGSGYRFEFSPTSFKFERNIQH
jgi:hypothetical protein